MCGSFLPDGLPRSLLLLLHSPVLPLPLEEVFLRLPWDGLWGDHCAEWGQLGGAVDGVCGGLHGGTRDSNGAEVWGLRRGLNGEQVDAGEWVFRRFQSLERGR